jgi:hypothetical protein
MQAPLQLPPGELAKAQVIHKARGSASLRNTAVRDSPRRIPFGQGQRALLSPNSGVAAQLDATLLSLVNRIRCSGPPSLAPRRCLRWVL